jgi:hypothetical protein
MKISGNTLSLFIGLYLLFISSCVKKGTVLPQSTTLTSSDFLHLKEIPTRFLNQLISPNFQIKSIDISKHKYISILMYSYNSEWKIPLAKHWEVQNAPITDWVKEGTFTFNSDYSLFAPQNNQDLKVSSYIPMNKDSANYFFVFILHQNQKKTEEIYFSNNSDLQKYYTDFISLFTEKEDTKLFISGILKN